MKSMLKIMKFNWEFNMNLNCFRLQNIHSRRLIPHFWNQFGWSIHMICKICNVFTRFLSIKGSNLEEGDFFFPLKIGTIIEDYQKNIQRLSVFTSRSGPMVINNIIFFFLCHTHRTTMISSKTNVNRNFFENRIFFFFIRIKKLNRMKKIASSKRIVGVVVTEKVLNAKRSGFWCTHKKYRRIQHNGLSCK